MFGDAGAISCVNSSIYSAAPPVRDGRWLLSTVYCTNPAHPDSVQIPIIDANNAGKCRVKIYACKCLCPIFDLRILLVSPQKSRALCFPMRRVFRCLVFVCSLIFLSFFLFFWANNSPHKSPETWLESENEIRTELNFHFFFFLVHFFFFLKMTHFKAEPPSTSSVLDVAVIFATVCFV